MANLNVANRTIFTGDNLDILRGFNSECVDLIYLDPPFNSNRNYAAPIGSAAAGAAFKDTWTLSDLDVAWMGLDSRRTAGALQGAAEAARDCPRQGDAVLPLHDGRASAGDAPGWAVCSMAPAMTSRSRAASWPRRSIRGQCAPRINILTPREMDVLRLVALGWRNEYIADELGVTLNTVRAHVTNLRHKLDADSRYGPVMAALRLGILELR